MQEQEQDIRNLVGELFLIVGGFILAETIIRYFLTLSSNALPLWVLPAFAVLLIVVSKDITNYKISLRKIGILSVFFLGISIVLVVLMKNSIITNITFLWGILILSVLTILFQGIMFFIEKIGRY